jgi:hypothetical protein
VTAAVLDFKAIKARLDEIQKASIEQKSSIVNITVSVTPESKEDYQPILQEQMREAWMSLAARHGVSEPWVSGFIDAQWTSYQNMTAHIETMMPVSSTSGTHVAFLEDDASLRTRFLDTNPPAKYAHDAEVASGLALDAILGPFGILRRGFV